MSLASSSSLNSRFLFGPPLRVVPPLPRGLPPRFPLAPPRPLPAPLPRVEAGVTGGTVTSSPLGLSTGSAFTLGALAVLAPPPLPRLPPVFGLAFAFGSVAGTSMSLDVTIWLRTASRAASYAGVLGAEFTAVVLATRERSELVGGENEGTIGLGAKLCCGETRVLGVELKKPRRGGEPRLGLLAGFCVDCALWDGAGDSLTFLKGCSGLSIGASDNVEDDISVDALGASDWENRLATH